MKNAVLKVAVVTVLLLVGLGCTNLCLAQTPRTPPSRPTRPQPDPPAFPEPAPTATIRMEEPVYVLSQAKGELEVTNLSGTRYHPEFRAIPGSTPGADAIRCHMGSDQEPPYYLVPVNGKIKAKFGFFFYEDSAGKNCTFTLHLHTVSTSGERPIDIYPVTIKVEAGQTYKIENTWDLKQFVSKAGVEKMARGDCEGLSVGSASVLPIPIGEVENNGDISFHVRGGILPAQCMFKSASPKFQLKAKWAIVDGKWKTEFVRGTNDTCGASQPSVLGHGEFDIQVQLRCAGTGLLPDNSNGVRVTLESITLIGPPHEAPLNAFRK
jgi:hypothetical protein